MMKVVIICLVLGYAAAQYAPTHRYALPVYAKGGYAPEPYYQPIPYNFGYDTQNHYGDRQWQQEQGDGYGNKQGSYGYTDASGISRQVDYVADEYGFRANVKTNEPGTANQNPADVSVYADPVPIQHAVPVNGYGHPLPHAAVPLYPPTPVYSSVRAHYPASY